MQSSSNPGDRSSPLEYGDPLSLEPEGFADDQQGYPSHHHDQSTHDDDDEDIVMPQHQQPQDFLPELPYQNVFAPRFTAQDRALHTLQIAEASPEADVKALEMMLARTVMQSTNDYLLSGDAAFPAEQDWLYWHRVKHAAAALGAMALPHWMLRPGMVRMVTASAGAIFTYFSYRMSPVAHAFADNMPVAQYQRAWVDRYQPQAQWLAKIRERDPNWPGNSNYRTSTPVPAPAPVVVAPGVTVASGGGNLYTQTPAAPSSAYPTSSPSAPSPAPPARRPVQHYQPPPPPPAQQQQQRAINLQDTPAGGTRAIAATTAAAGGLPEQTGTTSTEEELLQQVRPAQRQVQRVQRSDAWRRVREQSQQQQQQQKPDN